MGMQRKGPVEKDIKSHAEIKRKGHADKDSKGHVQRKKERAMRK